MECTNPAILDLWHPVAAEAELKPSVEYRTKLLGADLVYGMDDDGVPWAARSSDPDVSLPIQRRHRFFWTTIGEPTGDVFEIAEEGEADRRTLGAGSIKVATSAPRAVENFLDMGHFPYVHTGVLGAEPHTEVVEYKAGLENNEIWARECRFYQPMASASAGGGQMTEYTYRVPHPYCVMLYKSVPTDPSRMDVIGLFGQAMTEDTLRAHNYLCLVDSTSSDNVLKRFQQDIFSQDKPILENQHPKRLPLDPRIETPIRADKSAIVYRRWLSDLGVNYAVIPAA